FAYLPILVGFNAAKEFGGSGVLGAIAGAMSIANPAMPLLAVYKDSQILLPFTNDVFNPAAGGLLAALIAGMFFAFLEKTIRRIMPDIIDPSSARCWILILGVRAPGNTACGNPDDRFLRYSPLLYQSWESWEVYSFSRLPAPGVSGPSPGAHAVHAAQ
ncbi:MAG: PTS transporter subunit EIIC, partial [Clostridium sp.]